MVGLMGGVLSNTLWRAVGIEAPSGTNDTSGSNFRRTHVMGGFTAHPRLTRSPICNTRYSDLLNRSGPPTSNYRVLCCGRGDPSKGGCACRVVDEEDWVMFDLTSTPTMVPTVRCSQGTLARCSSCGLTHDTSTQGHEGIGSAPRPSSHKIYDNSNCGHGPKISPFECVPSSHAASPLRCPLTDIYAKVRSQIPSNRMSISPENENLRFRNQRREDHVDGSTDNKKDRKSSTLSPLVNPGNRSSRLTEGRGDRGQVNETEVEEAWRQTRPPRSQCALSFQTRSDNTCRYCGRFCHVCVMATSNTKEKGTDMVRDSHGEAGESLVPPEPPPAAVAMEGEGSGTRNAVSVGTGALCLSACEKQGPKDASSSSKSGVPLVGYREDIRAFDIYKITPHAPTSEAHYSRLPSADPSLTDSSSSSSSSSSSTSSDSDLDDARKKQGIRKRKRRFPLKREGDGEKRQREGVLTLGEKEEAMAVGLDEVTVYTSPLLEDYTNRISVLQRVSQQAPPIKGSPSSSSSSCRGPAPFPTQRRVSFTFGCTNEGDEPKSRDASSPSSTSPSHPFPHVWKDQGHDVTTADNSDRNVILSDEVIDDDDDDEDSTVVPDDFDEETDSDIEVLAQSESWVDLSTQPEESPDRVTPLPFGNGEEYIRLLREAQKESNHSSARVSLASSRRDTPRDSPHDSPKSPPNSPNTELTTDPEEAILKGVYINYYNKEGDFIRVEKNTETDWIWDWSSRPDQTPPKEWRFSHPGKGVNRGASIRRVMVGKSSLFSRDVLYTLLITNVLSLLIGTGIGIWLSKRSSSGAVVTLPIN